MAITELYSARQKVNGGMPDNITHNILPFKLRVQIVQILCDLINSKESQAYEIYAQIHKNLCREYGVYNLRNSTNSNHSQITSFIELESNIDMVFDVIEVALKEANSSKYFVSYQSNVHYIKQIKESIDELNHRFKISGVGYRLEHNQIIKISSTVEYQEIVLPTIKLLWNEKFNEACDDYMNAHKFYKDDLNDECINSCLKALEKTLKIICNHKQWAYGERDGVSKLITICFSNNLIPSYIQSHFTSLQSTLASGAPAVRNKGAAHGILNSKKADEELARYTLNLTSTNIIYLVSLSNL